MEGFYTFATMAQGYPFTSYISVKSPSITGRATRLAADSGVMMIDRFKFQSTDKNIDVEFDEADVAKFNGQVVTGDINNADVSLKKTADGWNLTHGDVKVMWNLGTRDFLVKPDESERFVTKDKSGVTKREIVDTDSDFVLIDVHSPVTRYIKLTTIAFWATEIQPITIGVFSISGNTAQAKALQTITPTTNEMNQIDVSGFNIRADKNDFIGFVQEGGAIVPYSVITTANPQWISSVNYDVPQNVGDTVDTNSDANSRAYSFEFDYEVIGDKEEIITTSVTLLAPREYGTSLSGLCGNCDRTPNDLETDAMGQPIFMPGTAGLIVFINSWSLQTSPFIS